MAKANEAGVPGTTLGAAPEPHVVKSDEGPVLELPSESEFQRAIQSFQVCCLFCLTVFTENLMICFYLQDLYDRAQRNARALQEEMILCSG